MGRLTAGSLGWGVIGVLAALAAAAEPPPTLTDAAFTDSVTARQPGDRLTSYSLGADDSPRLWFWFRVECRESCLRDPDAAPEIPIYVKWAHREDGTFVVKDTIPLTVRGATWRGWTYKENLAPGAWRVAIFTDGGPVCLEDQCQFTVRVTP